MIASIKSWRGVDARSINPGSRMGISSEVNSRVSTKVVIDRESGIEKHSLLLPLRVVKPGW